MIISKEKAVLELNSGKVVAIPTETVYGLAARIDRPAAIQKIFEIKERPFFDPLIVHVSSTDQARALIQSWSLLAEKLAEFFWPGPLTLVVPKNPRLDPMITSGLETVGLRSPWHKTALEIIALTGPLAAPSANKFGRTSPTNAEHVEEEFDGSVSICDGGPCSLGVESTILEVGEKELRILRPGMILVSQIEQFLKEEGFQIPVLVGSGKMVSPGSMKHHYMPPIPLILCMSKLTPEQLKTKARAAFASLPEETEGVKLLRPAAVEKFLEVRLAQDPKIAARELYFLLRGQSRNNPDFLFMDWQPHWSGPDWAPVVDRIQKAASCVLL